MSVQFPLFPKRIVDFLGYMAVGVTAPKWVRADDGLSYVVKDEAPNVPSVRASEYLWLSRFLTSPLPSALKSLLFSRPQF